MTKCAQCHKDFESPTGKVGGRCAECLAAEEQFHAWMANLMQTRQVRVARVLIAVNVAIFVWMVAKGVSPMGPSGAEMIPWGGDYGPLTLGSEWWRLLTSNFLHFGILHLGLNMWCLWDLSQMAERLVGSARFAVAYFLAGIGGSVASNWWSPSGVGAGASGAVFGVAGMLVAILFCGRIPNVPRVAFSGISSSLLIFVAYNLAIGAVHTGIGNSAHVGGLLVGLVFGLTLPIALQSATAASAATAAIPPAAQALDRRTVMVTLGVALLLTAGFADARRKHAPVVRLERASYLLESGQIVAALDAVQAVVAENPAAPGAQLLLGRIYVIQGRLAEAVAALQQALVADPEDDYASAMLGYALLRRNQPEAAIAPLRKALDREPGNFSTRFNLGTAYLESGNYAGAVEQFQAGLKLLPRSNTAANLHADTLASIGDAYLRSGDWRAAIHHLQQAAQLMPGPEAYSALSLLDVAHRMNGDAASAAEVRERMQKIETETGGAVPEPGFGYRRAR